MHEPLICVIERSPLQVHLDYRLSSFVVVVASQSNIRRFYRSGAGITCLSITYRPQAISFHHCQLLNFWCYSYSRRFGRFIVCLFGTGSVILVIFALFFFLLFYAYTFPGMSESLLFPHFI